MQFCSCLFLFGPEILPYLSFWHFWWFLLSASKVWQQIHMYSIPQRLLGEPSRIKIAQFNSDALTTEKKLSQDREEEGMCTRQWMIVSQQNATD